MENTQVRPVIQHAPEHPLSPDQVPVHFTREMLSNLTEKCTVAPKWYV